MYLVQILFQVLCLLLEFEIVARNTILELLVSILDLIELHFKFEYFFDTVEQVLMQLLLLGLVLGFELFAFLLDQTLLHLDHVRLFFL